MKTHADSQFSDHDEISSSFKGFLEQQDVGRLSRYFQQNLHFSSYLWLLPGPQSHVFCCHLCPCLSVNTLVHYAKSAPEVEWGEGGRGGGRERRRSEGSFYQYTPKSADKTPASFPGQHSFLPCSLRMRLQKHNCIDPIKSNK